MKLIDKDALVAEIKKHQAIWDGMDDDYCKGQRLAYSDVISFLDTLEVREVREESVRKDLEEAAFDYAEACKYDGGEKLLCVEHFKAGAQWQKQQNALEVKEVDLELITGWFDHIAQIADDRMTLTNQRMTDAHALDEIKCLAKNSSEFITKHYKAQKEEEV